MSRPALLLSNDDGIEAPGFSALVDAVTDADCADVYVCAPAKEQSAKSQALTLATNIVLRKSSRYPKTKQAFAAYGTPADSVMIAKHSQGVFNVAHFDLVLSGINRGDNCGLHVCYSGTVGAAREAACKNSPAIAFSLDNYRARSPSDYATAARHCVSLVKAALGLCDGCPRLPPALAGNVINVNLPFLPAGTEAPRGFHLTHMSTACVIGQFQKSANREAALQREGLADSEDVHVLSNTAAVFQKDWAEGGDYWAINNGWISVTPLGLMQDYALSKEHLMRGREFVKAVATIVKGAAQVSGLEAGGLDYELSGVSRI